MISSTGTFGLNRRDDIEISLGIKTENALEERKRWENMTPEEMVDDQFEYLFIKYGMLCNKDSLKSAYDSLNKKINSSKIFVNENGGKIPVSKEEARTAMERGIFFYKNQRNALGIKYNEIFGKKVLGGIMYVLNGNLPEMLKNAKGISKLLSNIGNIAKKDYTFKDKEEAVENLTFYFEYFINKNSNGNLIEIDYKKVLNVINNNNSYKENSNNKTDTESNKEVYNPQKKMEQSEKDKQKEQNHYLSLFKILKDVQDVNSAKNVLKNANNKTILEKEINKITSYSNNEKTNIGLICNMSSAFSVAKTESQKYIKDGKIDIGELIKAYKGYLKFLT